LPVQPVVPSVTMEPPVLNALMDFSEPQPTHVSPVFPTVKLVLTPPNVPPVTTNSSLKPPTKLALLVDPTVKLVPQTPPVPLV